uniref:Protein kinase C-binding protein NELL1-like n=1 Tax=Crassostrea virginica TaxID=6565 RepID=A0A8B8BGN0_CRAVI|nr:protein kinase C-binding protein NELL1-like [Crassostrea virginica]
MLVFNNFNYNKNVCSENTSWKRLFTVNCSSWKRDQYSIGMFLDPCVKTNAQCSSWQQLCVCHCNLDYVMVFGNCVKGNLMIRDSCVANEQCTWGGHHGLCTGHVCTCQEGYIAAYSRCFQGNVSVGGHCFLHEQCNGSPNTVMCSNDQKCVCKSGYIAIQKHCLKGNIALNMSCHNNEQCSHTPHALCLQRKCGCTEGYFAYNSTECLQDNVHVGDPCVEALQCQEYATTRHVSVPKGISLKDRIVIKVRFQSLYMKL